MSFGILSRARRHEPALALLLLRLWAGWEFARAGWVKLGGGMQAPAWFRGLDMPIPQSWLPADVNWLAAGILELLLGLALIVGLSTRLGRRPVALYRLRGRLCGAFRSGLEGLEPDRHR